MKTSDQKKIQGNDVLRLVDAMQREKNISKEVIFQGIEAALQLAAERATGGEEDVVVHIDRDTGELHIQKGDQGLELDPEELGRIAAYSAKQVVIQKIREAESESVFAEYHRRIGDMVTGTIQRIDAGTAIVSIGKSESLLPRSESIPGETYQVNGRVKAVIHEVKRNGHRVKIVLSRAHPDFVRALFENEIPEIADRTIEIKAVAREAGYRSKVAVSSIDMKVDCVGACVGVRGSRIKNIIEELNGERIDIVRWNDSLQVLIPNALQPAQISDVMLYPKLGRAIVLVTEDQLSLAIGRRGQNVRLASKLVGWDIEIMTHEELGEGIEKAERWFVRLPEVLTSEMAEALIEEGFLSYTDLTFMEPAQIAEMTGLSEDDADDVIAYCEEHAEEMEAAQEEEEQPAEEVAAVAVEHVEGGEAPVAVEGGETPAPSLESLFATEGPDEVVAEVPEPVEGEAPPEEGVAPSVAVGTLEDLVADAPNGDVQEYEVVVAPTEPAVEPAPAADEEAK